METIDCLIRYKGEKDTLYEQYNEALEKHGFSYIDKFELPGMEWNVLKYSYHGEDFDKDRQAIESRDENIQISVDYGKHTLEDQLE